MFVCAVGFVVVQSQRNSSKAKFGLTQQQLDQLSDSLEQDYRDKFGN
jgi:hypothetical protein